MLSRLLGSIGLIAGTSIGAGMLAMPVTTGMIGVIPSLVALVLVAAVMIYIGFLIIESLARMKERSTLISMAEETLGTTGRYLSMVSYIFLLFALNSSYLGVSTSLIGEFLLGSSGIETNIIINLAILLLLGGVVATSVENIDLFNRVLVIGLVISYFALNTFVFPYIQMNLVTRMDWTGFIAPLSLISTAFGYHILLPNIFDYLKRDLKQTKLAIIFGSLVPLVIYSIWQLSVLGSVDYEGPFGLCEALKRGSSALVPLSYSVGNDYVTWLGTAFSFFAIMTSFLGTFLGIVEFLTDAFSAGRSLRSQIIMTLTAALPIFLFNIMQPKVFFVALGYAGIMVAILIGILPIVMTYRSRQIHQANLGYTVSGGKISMLLASMFFLVLIGVELNLI